MPNKLIPMNVAYFPRSGRWRHLCAVNASCAALMSRRCGAAPEILSHPQGSPAESSRSAACPKTRRQIDGASFPSPWKSVATSYRATWSISKSRSGISSLATANTPLGKLIRPFPDSVAVQLSPLRGRFLRSSTVMPDRWRVVACANLAGLRAMLAR